MNVKVFNLISDENETGFLVQHELCECKCGLNKSVCNAKQKQNHDKCWCQCKELYEWGSCEKNYTWLPITCACQCNNACKIDEYLDTKNCLCKKRLNSKLVLECEDKTFNTTETS